MPKGESQDIMAAASRAKYLWTNRALFRKTKNFKSKEDTIFRPVAPFNLLTLEEADEYLNENKLFPPSDAYGRPELKTAFSVYTPKEKKALDDERKITVRLQHVSEKKLYKLRLPVKEFSLQLVRQKLTGILSGDMSLYQKSYARSCFTERRSSNIDRRTISRNVKKGRRK
eukprot:UN32294